MAAKKVLAPRMEEGYIPSKVEEDWYQYWEAQGYFKPASDTQEVKDMKKFMIVLPPPNVTGYLHLGHALTGAVQDTIVRYHRMCKEDVLYLPGTDHAGIATQVVVEKRVKAATGKSRHDLGREEFLKKVWDFKENHAGMITQQLRRIGSSLDWSRERFTMDKQCADAVTESFVQLHEQGKVYRATRLVNWCCALQSAISDLEVETEEVEKNAKFAIPNYEKKVDMGTLTHVAYKLVGSDEELVIATTRPETILGDTGVAIHPEDPRYTKFHGKMLQCPFRDEQIPIVLDSKLVEIEFGTGAVKLTPAHDKNDFEAGLRHNLRQMAAFDLKGNVCVEGQFFGMHRFDCRKAIVQELEKMGLLRGVEPYAYRVGRCSRTKDIIEPMLMPQWYINCESMAAKSIEAVRTKELKLIPESHESTWNHFLGNIEPWCVSRQLWWGHRIPAYKVTVDGKAPCDDNWVVARSEAEARDKAIKAFGIAADANIELDQDPDVLDTWFSSALWPFSTLGWPNTESSDLERFFPGNLLETGHDILFFWVARMVMMSLHFFDKLPFSEVYLHAMVRDKDGRKMSKQLGNVIDPLDVMSGITLQQLHDKLRQGNLDAREIPKAEKFQKEAFPDGIPECGSDALRFGLLSYTQSGRSVNLDINRVVSYKQFGNKLWNVVKFVLYFALGENYKPVRTSFEGVDMPLECRWILSRLATASDECASGFTEGTYDFAIATQSAYRFWLYELCDVFLELTKPIRNLPEGDPKKQLIQDVLLFVVEAGLRMLHPMMPFITEELYHRLPHFETLGTDSIMLAEYPRNLPFKDEQVEAAIKTIMECVHSSRSMKAAYQLTNKNKPDVWLACADEETFALINTNAYIVETLGVTGAVLVIKSADEKDVPKGCGLTVVTKDINLHMMLKDFINIDAEVAKLQKGKALLQKSMDTLQKKMSLPTYATKVPESIRAADQEKADGLNMQMKQTDDGILRMLAMKDN